MKIIVLIGSPKVRSITKQYARYLQSKFKQCDLEILDISSRINIIEQKSEVFDEIISKIKSCDGVIWAYPVYYAMIPAQFKRFIELIFERKVESSFNGKYSGLISSSINLLDNFPLDYMNGIIDDLQMKYVGYSTLNMYSIEIPEMRETLEKFMLYFLTCIENKKITIINNNPIRYVPIQYKAIKQYEKIDLKNKKAIILVDSIDNPNLNNMVESFKNNFAQEVEVYNIADNLMKGGCLGCLRCTYDYKECAYDGIDRYLEFYRTKVMAADIIVVAGTIKDRYLSHIWKQFFDRSFFNNHTPTLKGKQMVFIVSGPVRQVKNLYQMFQNFTQFQECNLVGVLSDEYETLQEIDDQIYNICIDALIHSKIDYCKTRNFIGIGIHKVLRDQVYGVLRYPLVGDYRTFRKVGILDFPHKKPKPIIINNILIIFATIFPKLRDEFLRGSKGTPLYRYFDRFIESSK